MAHAIEMRTRAVELSKEGYTQKFISKLLNVGTTSIKRWAKEIEEFGRIRFNYDISNRVAPKLHPDELMKYIKNNNDALLKEIAGYFNCTVPAVFYACERNKITYKKKNLTTENGMNKSVKSSKKR
jgi:transposase